MRQMRSDLMQDSGFDLDLEIPFPRVSPVCRSGSDLTKVGEGRLRFSAELGLTDATSLGVEDPHAFGAFG